jgi:biotin carboxyl carrier protein
MKITREFVRDGKAVAVVAEPLGGDRWRVRVGDAVHEYEARLLGDGGLRLQTLGGTEARAFVAHGAPAAKDYMVRVDGQTHTLPSPSARRGGGAAGSDGVVRAPMTGTVLEVACKPGDVVAADQTLVVVSAMKMEHKLTAGVAGTVQKVVAQKGGTVDQGAELVVVAASKETKS